MPSVADLRRNFQEDSHYDEEEKGRNSDLNDDDYDDEIDDNDEDIDEEENINKKNKHSSRNSHIAS